MSIIHRSVFLFFCMLLTLSVGNIRAQSSYTLTLDGVLSMDFVPVVGGSYLMGEGQKTSGKPNAPAHEVEISGFWMGIYEVDWEQYEAFMFQELQQLEKLKRTKVASLGIDGVSGASTPYVDMSFGMGKEGYPAVNMTQYAALMFCKWLSAQTGDFYRLPTEAEWEYACLLGTDGQMVELDEIAWFDGNAPFKYERVGAKKLNKLGIYDMLGNVSEWTMDQYDQEFYTNSGSKNPWNRPEKLYPKVVRGGSWKDSRENVGCKTRFYSRPQWKQQDPQMPKSEWWLTSAPMVGFRVVRPFVKPPVEEIKKYWLPLIEDYN